MFLNITRNHRIAWEFEIMFCSCFVSTNIVALNNDKNRDFIFNFEIIISATIYLE